MGAGSSYAATTTSSAGTSLKLGAWPVQVPAAVSSYLAIQALNPDLVISAGTAGGFKAQARRGRFLGCGTQQGEAFVEKRNLDVRDVV